MHEYLGRAVILDASHAGKSDLRLVLFMEKNGKIISRAQSARKITSKLAAHLQAGNLSRVRIIEKGTLSRVVDALKEKRLTLPPAELKRLADILAENQHEPEIWQMLSEDRLDWGGVLRHLGWDPAHGACRSCGLTEVSAFNFRSQDFFCANCSSHARHNELIFI